MAAWVIPLSPGTFTGVGLLGRVKGSLCPTHNRVGHGGEGQEVGCVLPTWLEERKGEGIP